MKKYLWPFVMVASLFFMWGFAHSILDVLNKHFQDTLEITKTRSALVQAMVYGGYFLMALPAGFINRKYGFKRGLVTGLLLYAIGALMFIPGSLYLGTSFSFFLLCLFVIGCGLTCLETAANPYVNILGKPEGAARRLNLAQSLNGLGWIVGPMVGSLLILGDNPNIALPYAIIGCITLALALAFSRMKLPEPQTEVMANPAEGARNVSLWSTPSYAWGVVALFFYVAAQTGINSFFINYVKEEMPRLSVQTAGMMLSIGGMGLLFVGRLLGSWLLKFIRPSRLMLAFSVMATACMSLVILQLGKLSVAALCLTYLFESVMFPTLFSMALVKVPLAKTPTASSFLIMSIVGGAIAPICMGLLGEDCMAYGFTVPLVCFFIIATYSLFYAIRTERR